MAQHSKKTTLLVLTSLAILATAATISPGKKFRNLKVLPQDISERQLDSVMDSYNKALKVSCDFCHAKPKTIDISGIAPVNDQLDFALDNEMKETARRMMRLTIDINKNYFHFDTAGKQEYQLNVVSCNTCHRGNPFPVHE